MRVGEEPNFRVSALALTANIPGAAYFMLINHFQKRYLEHNNKIDNVPYRNFLSKLFIPLEKKLLKNDYGLEFGCGHGPALADIIKTFGYKVDLYDPIFFPNKIQTPLHR